jgi:hypothetical protein
MKFIRYKDPFQYHYRFFTAGDLISLEMRR